MSSLTGLIVSWLSGRDRRTEKMEPPPPRARGARNDRVRFLIDADELALAVKTLSEALTMRPNPEGAAHSDLNRAVKSCSEYFDGMSALTEEGGEFKGRDLIQATGKISSGYHNLWRRPFPPGMEIGQALFSAVLERPMRDLLRELQSCADPEIQASPEKSPLELDAKVELNIFTFWLDGLAERDRVGLRSAWNIGYAPLAASFLLGWWIGND